MALYPTRADLDRELEALTPPPVFVVKRDDPAYPYLSETAPPLIRSWGPLKEAKRFATRADAYANALPIMDRNSARYNANVRVVRLVPPEPCPKCNGTGKLRSPQATDQKEGK